MGVQTMASLGGGGGGGGRQGAVYGLTLNEVESRLGSPLRSMNLDELLRTVLPAAAAGGGPGPGSGKKTVDEVWRDIESGARGRQSAAMEVGEMTLEDFLSRAGVPVDGGGAHWLLRQYHPPPRSLPVFGHGGGGGGGFLSPSHAGGGRKRGAGGEDEGGGGGGVERRQKRMIKNRESAARSRARKQAYMNELENKVSRLEEENRRLKELKRLEPMVQVQCVTRPEPMLQRLEPMVVHYVTRPESMVVQYVPEPEPEPEKQLQHQLQLRRTISASF
ncbi:ABSCISIC ACID-INSENSITIVE 5-like protein 5 [Brachypodium distachyon]|uniref:BZIP domain-containing protein n=1 Tax=Brachypodium distachyon TaxID=15368 RepID=A0A0Q3GUA0_BRADI|nr:ABSCISIC ACID-INSENSITIVE 5-like protein 5 [Brachypodium distachyon]KQK14568.1 hypothetical protein BRADI_1g17335v3 [Brachypodium distachyon]|eukprot:XP_014757254.1 ABSCISIC ACID-INSENSITIVE 5-like protein 5 [Brachypodium distachyon]